MVHEDIQIHQNQVRLNLTKSLIDQPILSTSQFNEAYKDKPTYTNESLLRARVQVVSKAKQNPENTEEILKSFNDELATLKEVLVEVPSDKGPRLETRYVKA